MTEMLDRAGLKVAAPLVRFVEERALPGTGLDADGFWAGLGAIYRALRARERRLAGDPRRDPAADRRLVCGTRAIPRPIPLPTRRSCVPETK